MQQFMFLYARRILQVAGLVLIAVSAHAQEFDIVIKGGRIVDGTGAPWYVADVGIQAGRIAEIGHLSKREARVVIDAKGLIVAPGFVDMMGQTATPLLDQPATALNLLTQGITTINAGEGQSAAPLSLDDGEKRGWTTMAEYFALLEIKGLPINVVQTVGHTQVRRLILGEVDRKPSDAELAKMQSHVREAMEAGAIGVSTALIYPPAVYADTSEIAALVSVAGEYGGRYYTHMRNEGDQLLEAIDEALEIGRAGHAPVHIFHLKAAGRQNWGKMELAIAKIKAARAAGENVTADIYPYVNNGLGIAALIHPRHFKKGYDDLRNRIDDPELRAEIRREMETTEGWENWYRHVAYDWGRVIIGQSNDTRYSDVLGQSVASIAQAKNEDPWETFFHLIKSGAFALPQSMTQANKIRAMQESFVSFCTDVGPAAGGRSASHPRAFGSFPRLLSHYVRDLGAISLERAVAQASAAAINDILVRDRGRISEGLAADVIVFDFEKLADRATFSDPAALSTGMRHVIVNGVHVLREGVYTKALPGRVLRGPGYNRKAAPASIKAGAAGEGLERFDGIVQEFMSKHRVPGASVAITDRGRLVYARGFGYSDIAKNAPVRPMSLFRIASISKPITAVAIMQLVDQGKIKLDQKVFAVLDYEKEIAKAGEKFDSRQRDITVRHLLQHRGGWDRGRSFDAMFQPVRFARQVGVAPPADQDAIIKAMFSQRLDFTPGGQYAYSNFGYCLLGRIIEKVSGIGYEQFVKQHVLDPCDAHLTKLGRTRLADRFAGEVRYYHPGTSQSVFQSDLNEDVPSSYGAWHLEAMDSHGAWISTAVELAKFATILDDADTCPLLSQDAIAEMYARPAGLAGYSKAGEKKKQYYGLGWMCTQSDDGKRIVGHSGSLPGTATVLRRFGDGRNIVVLFNSRTNPNGARLSAEIVVLIEDAFDEGDWPETDLFPTFLE